MTPGELLAHLHGLWPDLNHERTVDRVIIGSAEREINGVGVCWMPYSSTLREIAADGLNTVVTHEPTFFDHWESPTAPRYLAAKAEKRALIESLGLTILRCHDVWDAVDKVGVPFGWAKFLGLNDVVAQRRYLQVHRVEAQTARAYAESFAERTQAAGQGTVEFYGDPDRIITSVGIGTGCCSDALDLYDLGADLAVTVDDIARAWIVGEYCRDTGHPLIVVNHGVSEDCGMDTLAEEVRRACPHVPVKLYRQGASYTEIRSRR